MKQVCIATHIKDRDAARLRILAAQKGTKVSEILRTLALAYLTKHNKEVQP